MDLPGSPPSESTDDWIPAPGTLLAGRYQVEGLIGSGGMAAVLAAIQTDLGRRVAIKLLPPRAAKSALGVERFIREARAASAIDSDHVVRLFEVGRLESGTPFMVMEFLVGAPLSRTIERRGPLPLTEGIDYFLQTAVAIAHCHAIGVVHRDLKPENIMVLENPGQRGHVKVLDFGISKADWFEQEHTPSLTGTSDVFGTPTHMSPEQVRSSKSVDYRTDIWAMGVVLYEIFAGKPPFIAESLPALSAMIVSDEPTPPSHLRPDLPAELERLVLRCLAKRAENRPQSVHEIAEALAPFAAPSSHAHLDRIFAIALAKQLGASAGPAAGVSGPYAPLRSTASAWGTTYRRKLGARRGVALGVGAGLVLFAAVTVALMLSARYRAAPVTPDVEGSSEAVGPTAAGPSPAVSGAPVPAPTTSTTGQSAPPSPSSTPPAPSLQPRVRPPRKGGGAEGSALSERI
jgi:serine/threonine-protein kinase